MSTDLLPSLNTSTGAPYRRITFVPAVRPDAHSTQGSLVLVPLNDPLEVRSAGARAAAARAGPDAACVPSAPRRRRGPLQPADAAGGCAPRWAVAPRAGRRL
jgi:hypothetical protein